MATSSGAAPAGGTYLPRYRSNLNIPAVSMCNIVTFPQIGRISRHTAMKADGFSQGRRVSDCYIPVRVHQHVFDKRQNRGVRAACVRRPFSRG